jgi:hypothetical protein
LFTADINTSIYKVPHREGGESVMFPCGIALMGGRALTSPNFVVRVFNPVKKMVVEKHEFTGIPMLGFSADMINDKLYIFGGCSLNMTSNKECHKTLLLYSRENMVEEPAKNANLIVARKHHGHTVIEHNLVISGGVDSNNRLLND